MLSTLNRIYLPLLTAILVSVAQPLHAATWVEEVMDWFSDIFTDAAPASGAPTPAVIDSLRVTPLGLLLNTVPDADTMALAGDWPFLSANVAADLDRHNRLLRETVLLTDPTGKLPLAAPAVRVIYAANERPGYFIDLLSRFTNIQEVEYSHVLPSVLEVSQDLPTIILVNDRLADLKVKSWYQPLLDLSGPSTTLIHFGSADQLPALPTTWSVINTPLRCKESEAFLAQAIFGAQEIHGELGIATPVFLPGTGFDLPRTRAGYRFPEQLGIDREALERVDYQINRGIRYRAMPGAQLAVLKNGQVVYQKAYGHQTYRNQEVRNGDLYDLASVTKAAATTLAVMKLYDDGQLDLTARVRDYLPQFRKHLVGRYRIDQVLAHQTGLQPNLPVAPFMTREVVQDTWDAAHRFPLGPSRWLDSHVPELVEQALTGPLTSTPRPSFVYSDLNFYLLQLVVEQLAGTSLDDYVATHFYEPMGLGKIGFQPTREFPSQRLVPTANEPWLRGGVLRGYVHDEGAALLGGVAGHAGLFANAHNVARLFQLLNNEGQLDGVRYLDAATVATFTKRNPYNYRALGFDRLAGRSSNGRAGKNTIGHLGFTGTSVWADPENDLVFVLLSNRVHPDPGNNKFRNMNIRSRVTRAIYSALGSYQPLG